MRKIIAALLIACMLLNTTAFAQGETVCVMRVVNCQEWVSLREKPDSRSQCLVEVPLGALVENCRKETKAFQYGEYRGMKGYIMTQYLEQIPLEQLELGEMTIAKRGAWVPMYADAAVGAQVLQWMAPGTVLEYARESVEGYVFAHCKGVKGYVCRDALDEK